MSTKAYDDPRKLRSLIDRAAELASEHAIPSVVVGLGAREGDLQFPEFVEFVESALRVEDGIFRMTRERAVLHLADVESVRAREIVDRLLEDFGERFSSVEIPRFAVRLFEVQPGGGGISVREVLTEIFAPGEAPLLH